MNYTSDDIVLGVKIGLFGAFSIISAYTIIALI